MAIKLENNGLAIGFATRFLETVTNSQCGCAQIFYTSLVFLVHSQPKMTVKKLLGILEEQMPDMELNFNILTEPAQQVHDEEITP